MYEWVLVLVYRFFSSCKVLHAYVRSYDLIKLMKLYIYIDVQMYRCRYTELLQWACWWLYECYAPESESARIKAIMNIHTFIRNIIFSPLWYTKKPQTGNTDLVTPSFKLKSGCDLLFTICNRYVWYAVSTFYVNIYF